MILSRLLETYQKLCFILPAPVPTVKPNTTATASF